MTIQYIERPGLIFEAGSYKDKDFEMTPAELRSAVEAFSQPVDLDIEHIPTVFDGKLGQVVKLSADADNKTMHATVRLPKAVNDLLGDGPIKVSPAFHRTTKQLEKLSLVLNPRVKSAALFEAFSADDSPTEPDPNLVTFAASGELATPNTRKLPQGNPMKKFLDWLKASGAPAEVQEELAAFSADTDTDTAARGAASPTVATPAVDPAKFTALEQSNTSLQEQVTALFAQNQAQQAAAIAAEAERRAKAAIESNRMLPSMRDELIALFSQALQADATAKVTFSDGPEKSQVALLQAMIDKNPAHNLTAEFIENNAKTTNQVMVGGSLVTFSTPADEMRDLLQLTPEGRTTLALVKPVEVK